VVDYIYARKAKQPSIIVTMALTLVRRLAAATGNPVGVLDHSITTPPPADIAGFPSVAPLDTNRQLASITGQILHGTHAIFDCCMVLCVTESPDVYSLRYRTGHQLIAAIGNIVSQLADLDLKMAPECRADLSSDSSLTRTGATLSLMFWQVNWPI
jgi:proline utilization trans-activator